jgi:hypothetical protein
MQISGFVGKVGVSSNQPTDAIRLWLVQSGFVEKVPFKTVVGLIGEELQLLMCCSATWLSVFTAVGE